MELPRLTRTTYRLFPLSAGVLPTVTHLFHASFAGVSGRSLGDENGVRFPRNDSESVLQETDAPDSLRAT